MEWNAESVLDALNDFERKPELNPILEEYLQRIAKNGEIVFPWCKLKPLLKKKLEIVLDEFYETCPVETSVPVPNFESFNFDNLKKSILQALDAFTSAPFTIQRLCELVTNPQKHYNRTDKYMRGIEKNVLVVSTIEPRSGGQGDNNNVNNNVIVNGMINDSPRDDNDTLNGHESRDSVSSSNMNTSSSHVLLENFANVFPSAACIPSASSMCINRDMDSNFISTSENVENQDEIEFDRSTPTSEESVDNIAETKDDPDPMDISDEDSFHEVSMDNEESVTEELPESKEKDNSESCVDIQCESNITDEDFVDDKAAGNEADSSVAVELPPLETNVRSPQVQVVSQSDDASGNSPNRESFETIDETANVISSNEEHTKPRSPLQVSCSSLEESISPIQGSSSPVQGSSSPVQGSCSPVQGSCSPIQGSSSPIQGSPSPIQGSSSPVQGSCSPIQGSCSPIQGSPSPIQGSCSPVQGSCSPIQGSCSPIQGSCSPIQEPCSPLQEPCSPLQEISNNVADDSSEMCVSESAPQSNELELDNSEDCN